MEEHVLEVVSVALRLATDDTVEEARIVLGAVACQPLLAQEAAASLLGRPLDQDAIAEAASRAARIAKPLDNTDFEMTWRKKVAVELVTHALRELRGEDMRAERLLFTGVESLS
jgi:CO/xanthine dehydrogenase FAD-binding subunit